VLISVLGVLFRFGMRRDMCVSNPAASPGRLPPPKRDEIWSRAEEERVVAAFPAYMRLTFYLLLYTTQRLSDVLAMRRDAVTDRNGRLYIALKQSKTGALIDVPVHSELAPLLRERLAEPFKGEFLIPGPKGKGWKRQSFNYVWDSYLRKANLRLARELLKQGWTKAQIRGELASRHRQRRDLRRTGIVRLAEAGATTPEIAAISGHQIDTCQKIIDTYLPRRTEVALGGIEKWERGQAVNVVQLRTKS
jgi:integrase